MLFELKKIITSLIMPLPAMLLIGVAGLILLWLTRRQLLGKILVSCSLLCLAALSSYPLARSLMYQHEQHYPAYDIAQPTDLIMVLGHSHVVDPTRPPQAQLSSEALARLMEAMRIWRAHPQATMILSGYNGGTSMSHAELLHETAIALGVPTEQTIMLTTSKDTSEEAAALRHYLNDEPFALVSSASHLPRAIDTFEQYGLNPVPAPAYYLTPNEIHEPWHYFSPKAQYLRISERYWHEWLGTRWYEFKTWAAQSNAQSE